MYCFLLKPIILIAGMAVTFGQNNQFDYECDILTRLEHLENELKDAQNKQDATDTRLRATEYELRDTKKQLAVTDTKLTETSTELRETTEMLVNLNSTLTEALTVRETANPGSTYIRWGRTTCPGNGTELVYSGSAGGNYYNQGGAGAEYICLPNSPIYGNYTESSVQGGATVRGAEYQLDFRANRMKFFPDLVDRTDLLNHDVPCAVCRTGRSTTLMIPARNMCMDDWILEYKGLLVGDFTSHASSNYICLDDQPERIDRGSENKEGKLLYFVEGICGSLPCPPFENGKELTCVVCTK